MLLDTTEPQTELERVGSGDSRPQPDPRLIQRAVARIIGREEEPALAVAAFQSSI